MKKILVLFLVVYMSVLSAAGVDDKAGILTEIEKAELEKRVEEVSEKTGLDIYMNYFTVKDSIELKEVEKSVIINFLKQDSSTLEVRINLTQDVSIEEYRGNIENTLDNLEPFLKEEKYLKYSMELLGSIEEVLVKTQSTDEEKEKDFEKQGNSKAKIIILLVFLGGLFYLRKRKNK